MNILIGSCGGLTGQYLIKQFRNFPERPTIYGFDANYYCYARTICDYFFTAPPVSKAEEFLGFLTELINSNNIQLYIPTLSMEYVLVSEHEDFLKHNTKCFFAVSPIETFRLLEDKFECYKNLSTIGIDVPITYQTRDEVQDFPVFVKPKIGSGGKGSFIANSLAEISQDFQSIVVSEYLKGTEYTVDCLFNCSGVLLAANARTRDKTLGGAAIISRTVDDPRFFDIIQELSQYHQFKGCVNFQFIEVEDRLVCIDVNLRFPSGGLALTVESGIDVPRVLYTWAQGENPDPSLFTKDKQHRIMYRYFEEEFELL